ncbi:HTH domain-containing protein [Streptomyces liliifuscus]|uniref:HTH domain-containing protein n=1 Tax=Streptomyces liliifuscus TaxID=2797636 RepID=A0A7T7L1Z7_9ACTN|nr:HTH domain-containing protein [Streptomyces liliifuscus]QQM44979.1 HTH domain-containing protein [Streptomyces liliifuscus]
MTRTDRLTLVRQLKEGGLSQRAIAKRLGVSKDTVRRDFERLAAEAEPDDAPPAEPDDQDAPQVSEGDTEGDAPGDAPQSAPLAQPDQAAAPLPRRMAQAGGPLALPDGFDLRQWPAVRRDLATLAQTGQSPETLVHHAITAVAHHYRQALDRGDIAVGESFTVSHVTLRPLPVARRSEQAG